MTGTYHNDICMLTVQKLDELLRKVEDGTFISFLRTLSINGQVYTCQYMCV